MKGNTIKAISAITAILLLSTSAVGCSGAQVSTESAATTTAISQDTVTTSTSATTAATGDSTVVYTSSLETSELFSNRDLEQSVDLTNATTLDLQSNKDVSINTEGIYVLSGEAENVTIIVEAADDAKVQIVLDGVSITNEDAPAIYVKTADKVYVTTTNSQNSLKVTGSYVADGEINLDAVIFSKTDLTLNGSGTLEIISSQGNGISAKDDLIITGGTYNISSALDSIEANNSILINGGTFTIDSGKDALHCENDEDTSLGYIYIKNGTLNITAADDAIRANRFIQIDGGTVNIETCEEGIEANNITINDGRITLYAKNDGINAAPKVDSDVSIEVNGGTINLTIGSGDTDAFDSNGTITVNAGTITIEATSAFDADGTATLNGGTVTVNGEQITQITQSRGGGMGGGFKH